MNQDIIIIKEYYDNVDYKWDYLMILIKPSA